MVTCEFSLEELELLCHGFGFFVQEFEFNMQDGDPAHILENKLIQLLEQTEAAKGVKK